MLYMGLYHTLRVKTIVYMLMKKLLGHNLRLIFALKGRFLLLQETSSENTVFCY